MVFGVSGLVWFGWVRVRVRVRVRVKGLRDFVLEVKRWEGFFGVSCVLGTYGEVVVEVGPHFWRWRFVKMVVLMLCEFLA